MYLVLTDAKVSILEFTENASELLNRKKVKREVLVQYLADVKCPFSINADKSVLVQTVLDYWGSQPTPQKVG
jgi:exo-beta-1,3-glucanase (GH17 family)